MAARCLMVVGASSSAGKSLLAAALCRIFARRGLRVAPFKAQNMSNNAAVCPDGGEIGRAQAMQALAAGAPLSVDFNPVLIKPEADARSQVVVLGRPFKTLSAAHYYDYKAELWAVITAALDRLRAAYDLVVIEGAGSPAELNLKPGDLVNMRVAQYAQAPTLLVGDIDRGGIFAQLLGTLWLLDPSEQAIIRGLVVNKFRGDPALFVEGVRILEERSQRPVLGVIPWLPNLGLPEEDAVALDTPAWRGGPAGAGGQIDLAVIHLPHIANFDDFDPFGRDPGVRVRYVTTPEELGRPGLPGGPVLPGRPSAVLLPGTKSTLADLDWLRRQGLAEAIRAYAGAGGAVVGVCGGYQMLGQTITDPQRVESAQERMDGLGLLPIHTTFEAEKATHQAAARLRPGGPGWLAGLAGQILSGYEIHMGRTASPAPWLEVIERSGTAVQALDGSSSLDGRVWGCYLHGLFENAAFRRAWLGSLGWQAPAAIDAAPGDPFDRLADAVEQALDLPQLEALLWEN